MTSTDSALRVFPHEASGTKLVTAEGVSPQQAQLMQLVRASQQHVGPRATGVQVAACCCVSNMPAAAFQWVAGAGVSGDAVGRLVGVERLSRPTCGGQPTDSQRKVLEGQHTIHGYASCCLQVGLRVLGVGATQSTDWWVSSDTVDRLVGGQPTDSQREYTRYLNKAIGSPHAGRLLFSCCSLSASQPSSALQGKLPRVYQ